jgi:hypothetical protein
MEPNVKYLNTAGRILVKSWTIKYPYYLEVSWNDICRPDEYWPTSLNNFAYLPNPYEKKRYWFFSTMEDMLEFIYRKDGKEFETQRKYSVPRRRKHEKTLMFRRSL